jgi:AcrR family transcriptional regulator
MAVRAARAKPEVRQRIRRYARTAYTEEILAAAERLFLRVGYTDAKMQDLAAEAGVAVGTLYKYFPSKDEVFASLTARGREEVLKIVAACRALPDPSARLPAFVERLFAYVEERGALFAIYVQLGVIVESHIRSFGGVSAEQTYVACLTALEAVFQDGIDSGQLRSDIAPSVLAATLAGAMNATMFTWLRAERSHSLRERAEPLLDLFLKGARAS